MSTLPDGTKKADHAVGFFSKCLQHVKGPLANQPFVLEPWQEKIVRDLFGTLRADGTRRYRKAYIEIPRKNGKALEVSTPVPTTAGWKSHGDLQPGDMVFSPSGDPVKVEAVTPQYTGACYDVHFADGTIIRAHARHEWDTERTWYTGKPHGKQGALPFVETERIASTLRMKGNRRDLVHRVRIPAAVNIPEMDLPIDPYVLGVWLGDGHSADARVTSGDEQQWELLESHGCTTSVQKHKLTRGVGRGWLKTSLRECGLLKNKHIPKQYLFSGVVQRWQLLRGLMDTDGYVSKAGQCEFTTTIRQLGSDVLCLIRSLGIKGTMHTKRAMLNGRDCGEKYRLQFWAWDDTPPVLLTRKQKRLRPRPQGKTRNSTKTITACVPCGDHLVNCIQVQGGMYLAGDGWTPTHNSTFAAGLALYLLIFDGEQGAEVYSAASTRDQASLVYSMAAEMLRKAPGLLPGVKIRDSVKRIIHPKSSSFYRAIAADAGAAHGFNAHGIIFDEVHTQPDRELWDVLDTSTGARSQPLTIAITTAGHDKTSICYELHKYAKAVRDGAIQDDGFYPVIFGADPGDDWRDESTWEKANPCLDIAVTRDYLREQASRAEENPAFENTFRRLHLNQWTEQESRIIPMHKWDECQEEYTEADLEGRPCYGGLDLSSTRDVTAFVLVFPEDDGGCSVLPWFWIPEENVDQRAGSDQRMIRNFAERGMVELTDGNEVDVLYLAERIMDICSAYNVQYVGFDPWNAAGVTQMLKDRGLPDQVLLKMTQSFGTYNEPFKAMLSWVGNGKFRHNGNEVLRWMASNVAHKEDPSGNIRPDKGRSAEKIDGICSTLMGIGLQIHYGVEGSAYADSGSGVILF